MRDQVYSIAIFILAIWLVFVVDTVIPASLVDWGLRPRTVDGLIGIPLMPFLHASLGHLVRNTIPLIILLLLLSGSRANPWMIVISVVLLNGALLWLFGRDANHVGASGLVFALISFLIVSGLIEKRLASIAIAVIVGFLYGGTLIGGVVPRLGSAISWDGHLAGATAGGIVAYVAVGRRSAGNPKGIFAN